ncbi:hypothetical protein [Streptomyces tirandamycinicus]|uniref:Uncharacterized protein n=1 Tax=Streptomyces tirandamycinicus TaxID=2174846 RepID=A0A2S1T255_9ACTN|nr:hypothetical protein [Streptomyces tirandamycinicus]AWI32721.1 hypothetical protein DDW44_30885 [Streptomyces tirandamycinicus]
MKITIECEDPAPPELVAAVTDLMARIGPQASVSTDDGWTVERAEKLLRDTNPRTLLLFDAAIEGEGWVDGPAFREKWGDNALRGPSQTITKAIKRGAERGHWSADITPPFTPTTPDKSGWSKTGGYYLGDGLLPVFREAMKRYKERSRGE